MYRGNPINAMAQDIYLRSTSPVQLKNSFSRQSFPVSPIRFNGDPRTSINVNSNPLLLDYKVADRSMTNFVGNPYDMRRYRTNQYGPPFPASVTCNRCY